MPLGLLHIAFKIVKTVAERAYLLGYKIGKKIYK